MPSASSSVVESKIFPRVLERPDASDSLKNEWFQVSPKSVDPYCLVHGYTATSCSYFQSKLQVAVVNDYVQRLVKHPQLADYVDNQCFSSHRTLSIWGERNWGEKLEELGRCDAFVARLGALELQGGGGMGEKPLLVLVKVTFGRLGLVWTEKRAA